MSMMPDAAVEVVGGGVAWIDEKVAATPAPSEFI
jgi:hypothetical protein